MHSEGYYILTMSRCLSWCPIQTSAFLFASHEYWTDFDEIWER